MRHISFASVFLIWIHQGTLATAHAGETVLDIPETDNFVNRRVLQLPDNPSWPFKYYARRLLFSPDGAHLVVWDEYSDKVHIWNVAREEIVSVIDKKQRADPDFAYIEGGKYLVGTRNVMFGEPHEFIIYETSEYKEIDSWQPKTGKKTLIATPDGNALAYTSGKKGLRSPVRVTVFDVINKSIIKELSNIDGLDIVAFSHDGRQLADGTTEYHPGIGIHNNEYHIRIWNYPDLDLLLTIQHAHPAKLAGLTYSKDGKRLYSWSGSTDERTYYSKALKKEVKTSAYMEPIKVWDAHTGEKLDEIEGIVGGLYGMHTTNTGNNLLLFTIKNGDAYVILFDLGTKTITSTMRIDASATPLGAIAYHPTEDTYALGIEQSIVLFDIRADQR